MSIKTILHVNAIPLHLRHYIKIYYLSLICHQRRKCGHSMRVDRNAHTASDIVQARDKLCDIGCTANPFIIVSCKHHTHVY